MLYYRCPDGKVVNDLDLTDELERCYTREMFDATLDEEYRTVQIRGYGFSPSRILRELDPDGYECCYSEEIDVRCEELMDEFGFEELYPGDEEYPEEAA